MKRKLLTAFCSSVCAMSLGLGTMLLFPASAAEQTLKNLALDADSFVTNSNIVENAVAFGTDGIRISDWGTSLSNGTAGVYYKEKVAVGETVSVKMSGYSQNGNNGRFVIQLGMTQTCQNASLYPWATAGNTGKVINMEFKPAWLELTTKDNGTYDSQTVASGNANKNGPLSGAYNVLDKAEHVVTVSKSDTETGISLTIAVDGQAYVENFALEETALQGDYYFSTGMQAWGDVTLSEEEYLSVSELTVSNVYEEADPLPAVPEADTVSEDVSAKADWFTGSSRAAEDSLSVNENGVMLKNYAYEKAAAAFLKKQIAADSTVTFKFKANGEFTDAQKADAENYPANGISRFGIALTKSAALYDTSFDYWQQAGAEGKEILIEFSATGWISVKTFTLGKYQEQMDPSEKLVIADGNGNGDFYAGTKLMDGNEHTVVLLTEDTETGMKLSIVIDGQWYVLGAELAGEEYKGNWFLSTGIYFNFPVKGTSDDSQYLNVTELRVSDYAPEEVLPDYDEIYDDTYNLASNKYNFAYDEALVSMEASGLSLNNIVSGIGNGFSITNGKVNEFDWAFKFNLSLYSNWDATGKPDDVTDLYDYSMLKFGFMMDSGTVPTGAQSSFKNMYYGFAIGKDYRAIPGSYEDRSCFLSFARYKGFSDSTGLDSYVNYKFGYNLVDGNDHWIVLKVRNVDDENGQGVSMELWLDGRREITLTDYNKKVEDKGVTYDWDVYERAGYLCMWTGSNNTEPKAQSSTCLFKEMYVVSYDEDPEGKYMEQAQKPDYRIERNYDFRAEDVYYTGETVRINLINAFVYEGDSALSFTVVNNETKEAVGAVVNGQWVYAATKEEFFKIKITANTDDGKTQFNIVDINIEEEASGNSSSGSSETTSAPVEAGCGSSISAFGTAALFLLSAAGAVILKKKH